uniref:Uncharacterized protein n=1 Tax=uncultured bacterium contig00053 TaxID=1181537 RepID=A0A806KG85_9BACT|nr:hypothetical protein [uncultured bacterium contig00053]
MALKPVLTYNTLIKEDYFNGSLNCRDSSFPAAPVYGKSEKFQ